ncbi:MAG: hypothetical protein WCS96_00230 [Victivallales bacterium]|jgi:hypothetical protein
MIKLDFYESGKGETIIITFPGGGIGVVDAHPSEKVDRLHIIELVKDKKIHFLCLTHPHLDHAKDLLEVVRIRQDYEFWHTVPSLRKFFFVCTEREKYPSPVDALTEKLFRDKVKVLTELFWRVKDCKIVCRSLLNNQVATVIDQVEIYCLSPSERIKNKIEDVYEDIVQGKNHEEPEENSLSAVLALKYGDTIIILGGDALKKNWNDAYEKARKINLGKALIIKVPHHGASNSLNAKSKENHRSYLEFCKNNRGTKAVLFAGDSRHPDEAVFAKLKGKAVLHCTANGLKTPVYDPLDLKIPGAKCLTPSKICNPVISFTCDDKGNIVNTMGHDCSVCN